MITENTDATPFGPDQLFDRLQQASIRVETYHHPAIFTVADGEDLHASIPGLHCRNLFLRDKKGAMFLVTAANETKIDIMKLQRLLGSGRLSFGSPERLWHYLGVRPGSVCPFAVINDKEKAVRMVLDDTMMTADLVAVHPLDNTMSVTIAPADLVTFLRSTGHEPDILDMSTAAPDVSDNEGG